MAGAVDKGENISYSGKYQSCSYPSLAFIG